MSWWADGTRRRDVDVYLTVGRPPPRFFEAFDLDQLTAEVAEQHDVVQWADALTSIARTILSSGARLVVSYDGGITETLAAIALEYADTDPEDSENSEMSPLEVVIGRDDLEQLRSCRGSPPSAID